MMFSFYSIPIYLPFNVLRKLSKVNPVIVNYHVVSDRQLPHIANLYNYRTIQGFIEDVNFFCRHYHPIGMLDFLNHIRNNEKLPDNSLIITFDDGFREIHDIVLPILLEKRITATAFLTSDFIDNKQLGYPNKKSLLIEEIHKLSEANLKALNQILIHNKIGSSNIQEGIAKIPYKKKFILDEMAQLIDVDFQKYLHESKPYLTSLQIHELIKEGITIGSHSVDHANFAELSVEDQILQATKSMQDIKKAFNLDYDLFAFPFTDIGISKTFFDLTSHVFDSTFGTQNIFQDTVLTNFQRINIEKFKHSARKTLKSHYLRYLFYSAIGKNFITRE